MGTIHSAKIGTRKSVAAGATKTVRWNNPPWATVLSYWAVPIPPTASGSHGTSSGRVEVTRVRVTHERDNYNGDKQYVQIDVHNSGGSDTEFDLYQSWIT
jgi:hypothetical protein